MLRPQFLLPLSDELVVDLFAGGGGGDDGDQPRPAAPCAARAEVCR